MYATAPAQSKPSTPVANGQPSTANKSQPSEPQVEYDVSHVAVLGYN